MIRVRTERPAGSRAMAFGLLVVAFMVASLLAARPAHAATFIVNSTNDLGDVNRGDGVCDVNNIPGIEACTLRAAIQEANAFPGADTIEFDIGGGTGVKTISPSSELPTVTDPVTINGYTQPGASPNTQEIGTNAVLQIQLDGENVGALEGEGLRIDAPDTTIKGLVINRFGGSGIEIVGDGTKDVGIEGNFIGTDATGTQDLGNRLRGVQIKGVPDNTVGGTTPEVRNVISGNDSDGVLVFDVGATGNEVQGNLIGTKKDGTSALGNFFGVRISASNSTVGGNTIAFNDSDGVRVADISGGLSIAGVGNRILDNSIFSNGELGINLGNDGVTPNDPKDPDPGPNNLQNFPELASAKINPDGTVTITGKLNSRSRKTFTIQFFSSPEADPSGFGEGKTFLGRKTLKTSRKGDRSFSFTFTPAQPVTPGEFVTATATRNSTGDTSEFSGAVTMS